MPGVIAVGSRVGGYTVMRLLGQGGMGQVFLAEHPRIARRVAVKVLLPELSANESVVERFFIEARATSLIKHPGIVEVLDCDVLDNQAYIVMEFLEGESLAGYLARVGSLGGDLGFALAVVGQVAEAVGAAHASDIIHRDLKPDNIFLCASSRTPRVVPKVLDFGIAKLAVQGASGQTRTGMLMGTPAYMSPEQCRGGSKTVDGRSDIYALGCIFYELLCCQPPFVRDGAGELIVAHVAEAPDDPRTRVPSLPPAIATLVLRMLGKNPPDRPATMGEVSAEIAGCIAGLGIARALADIHPRQPVQVPPALASMGPLATPTPGATQRTPAAAPSPVPAPARVATRPFGNQPTEVATEPEAVPQPTTLGGAVGQHQTGRPDGRPRRSAARWLVPVLVAAGGTLAIGTMVSRPHTSAPAAAAAPPVAVATPAAVVAPPAPPPPAAPTPAPRPVTIELRGLPAGATLLLDGAPTAGPSLKLQRDDRRHVVVARAPGFYDRTIEVAADHDQAVDVGLVATSQPEKPGHAGVHAHHLASAHGAPATKPAPAPSGQKKTNYDDM